MPPPPGRRREPVDARRARPRRATSSRHGWPGTGHARARQPAHGTSTCEQLVRHPPRAPAHGRDGRGEQRDDRRADRRGQVRRAGVADDDASAPASTSASSASVVRAAEVDAASVAGDERGERPLAGAPVTTHAGARRAPARATSAAWRSGAQARAGTEAPGCTTT